MSVPRGPGIAPGWKAAANTLQLGASSGTQKLAIIADNSCDSPSGDNEFEIFDSAGESDAANVGPHAQVELTQANACSGVRNGSSLVVDSGTLVSAGSIATDGGTNSSPVTGRTLKGSFRNAGGTVTIGAPTTWSGSRFDNGGGTIAINSSTTWAGTTFDNAGRIAFSGSNDLLVPAQTGETFINDGGGSIVRQNPRGYVLLQRGNTFQEGAGTVSTSSTSPGVEPGVMVEDSTLAYSANAVSSIAVAGKATLVGDVPSGALLAIDSCPASQQIDHTGSFTNAGFILLASPPGQSCGGVRLSVDSNAGQGGGTLTNAGRVEGSATIAGNVSNTTGSILPGYSGSACSAYCSGGYAAGLITVSGNYTQGPAGVLRTVKLNSCASCLGLTAAGGLYSQLSVQGTAKLDGTLDVIAPTDRQPPAGESERLLTAQSVTGRFASLVGQLDPSSTSNRYVLVYNPTNVTIDVVLFPRLTITMAGGGTGTVTSSPSGIHCGIVCSWQFSNAQRVTLRAVPAFGSRFAGWSGSGCIGTGPCTVTVIGDASGVGARFTVVTPPKCKLSFASPSLRSTARGHGRGRRFGTAIAARVVCNQPARLRLSDTVSEWLGWKHKPHARHWHVRRFLRGRASRAITVVMPLPAGAGGALAKGHVLTIKLALAATDSAGTSHASTDGLQLVSSRTSSPSASGSH